MVLKCDQCLFASILSQNNNMFIWAASSFKRISSCLCINIENQFGLYCSVYMVSVSFCYKTSNDFLCLRCIVVVVLFFSLFGFNYLAISCIGAFSIAMLCRWLVGRFQFSTFDLAPCFPLGNDSYAKYTQNALLDIDEIKLKKFDRRMSQNLNLFITFHKYLMNTSNKSYS